MADERKDGTADTAGGAGQKGASGPSEKKDRAAVGFDHLASVRRLDAVLNWLRRLVTPEMFDTISDWFAIAGHYALVGAQILAVTFCLIAAIKLETWSYVGYAAGSFLLLVILQYTADKFLNRGRQLVQSSPSRLGSAAFLDCVALLALVGGVAAFITYCVEAKQSDEWNVIWIGLGVWVLCDAVTHVALNPSLVNMTLSPGLPAGEEAIGILSFLVKVVVRVAPIAFGIGVISGTLVLLWAHVGLLKNTIPYQGIAAVTIVGACAAVPLASYILFAFYHLTLDIIRAVLVVPHKLDELRGGRKD